MVSESLTPYSSRNAAGERICVRCGGPLGGRKRRWCGDECVAEFKALKGYGYREAAMRLNLKRHGGRVLRCECCDQLLAIFLKSVSYDMNRPYRLYSQDLWRHYRPVMKLHLGLWKELTWEVDHIQARSLGGGHDLDNLWVLCHGCHRAKTKEDKAELARRRREDVKSGIRYYQGGTFKLQRLPLLDGSFRGPMGKGRYRALTDGPRDSQRYGEPLPGPCWSDGDIIVAPVRLCWTRPDRRIGEESAYLFDPIDYHREPVINTLEEFL